MTDNGSDWIKQANEMAALSLWHSYCDKKMELEDANDRIEQLTSGPGGIMEMKQTIADKEKRIEQLEKLLHEWTGFGCPYCSGDCGSANPPVIGCIMQETRAILEGKTDDQ